MRRKKEYNPPATLSWCPYRDVWICLSAVLAVVEGTSSCSLTSDGRLPPPGDCTGPMERTLLMRANVAIFNENCSISQVAFYVDGNSSAPVVVRFEVCLFCDLCFFSTVRGMLSRYCWSG
jgi:hypothetical protein